VESRMSRMSFGDSEFRIESTGKHVYMQVNKGHACWNEVLDFEINPKKLFILRAAIAYLEMVINVSTDIAQTKA
jgi:hypothetical protein